jgi:hypothetical protein
VPHIARRGEGLAGKPRRRTPLVRASAPHGVSDRNRTGSHLGSTLKPGRAVLTLGVFRRSRSVACIHVDASPSEVHTLAMVALGSMRVNSTPGQLQPSTPRTRRLRAVVGYRSFDPVRLRETHAAMRFFGHPAAGGRGITVTWNPYRGPLPK